MDTTDLRPAEPDAMREALAIIEQGPLWQRRSPEPDVDESDEVGAAA